MILAFHRHIALQVSTVTSANIYQCLGIDNSWDEASWKKEFKVCMFGVFLLFHWYHISLSKWFELPLQKRFYVVQPLSMSVTKSEFRSISSLTDQNWQYIFIFVRQTLTFENFIFESDAEANDFFHLSSKIRSFVDSTSIIKDIKAYFWGAKPLMSSLRPLFWECVLLSTKGAQEAMKACSYELLKVCLGYDFILVWKWWHYKSLIFLQVVVNWIKEKDMEFDLINLDPAIANALRRILIADIPTVAFEHIFFINNTSIIQVSLLNNINPFKSLPQFLLLVFYDQLEPYPKLNW